MLKWTVGQRRGSAAADGRGASAGGGGGGGGPCYSIRRAAARLYRPRSKSRTPSRSRGPPPGKENTRLSGSEDGVSSPRTRDSVYMRLDALPAALRDLSNRLQQPGDRRSSSPFPAASAAESPAKRPRRHSAGRARRISRVLNHVGDDTHEVTTTPRRAMHRTAIAPWPDGSPCSRRPKRTRLSQGELSFANSSDQSMVTLQPEPPTMQIDYSPCPLRTTKSLIALRRRLEDTFSQTHHSVGTLHPTAHHSLDNPLYYTLSGGTSNLPRCSDHVPAKIRRKNIMSYSNDIPWNITPSKTSDPDARAAGSNHPQLSVLTSSMARLDLNITGPSACPATSPSQQGIMSTTPPPSIQTVDDNVADKHDATDPRFLSLFSIVESTLPVPSSHGQGTCQGDFPGTGSRSHNSISFREPAEHSTGMSSQQGECTVGQSGLRSTLSLGKIAPVISSVEKENIANKDLMRGSIDHNRTCISLLNIPELGNASVSFSRTHSRDARNRETIVSPCALSNRSSSNKSGCEGLLKSEYVCDSFAGVRKEPLESDNSRDSIERSFSLRRQGGFRRRQRPLALSEAKGSRVATPEACSPPGAASSSTSLIVNAPSSAAVGGPSCSLSRPRSSSSGERARFGLTLSQGIPSPPSPSPSCRERDDELTISLGVRPLAESPPPPPPPTVATDATVTVWRRNERLLHALSVSCGRRQPQQSPASSSDETWNSHTMRFLKTPQLTSAHVLEGAAYTTPDSSANSSASRTDHDVSASPVALVERRSRSRRCLTFASPGGSTKHRRPLACRRPSGRRRSHDCNCCQHKGELELAVYANSGLLTIHVIRGWNLHKAGEKSCNAYVKVNLVPSCEERTFHRTSVQKDSSNPWFDQKFSFEVLDADLDKRVLVSVWHRDKERKRSEFLGCMSFSVKHAVKKDIGGSYRLLSQSSGQTQHQSAAMPRHSVSSCEEVISLDSDVPPTPRTDMERRKSCTKKPVESKAAVAQPSGADDSSFLRHLELEPAEPETGRTASASVKGGRTPFTTTRRLVRHGRAGFGFSVAWTQPPRVERVEAGQPADRAGLRPGDYVIFVERHNVVTMPEEEILNLIRSCGNVLTLEVYRRATPNGLVSSLAAAEGSGAAAPSRSPAAPSRSPAAARSSVTTCSATTASLDLSKRRLHLPQVTFSSEVGTGVIV